MEISMDNIICKRVLDNNSWRDMSTEEQRNALHTIKEFLLSTCRGTNTEIYKAIQRMSIDNLPSNFGIMRRLTTKGYCAGQDYPTEIQTIKNIIKKEC